MITGELKHKIDANFSTQKIGGVLSDFQAIQ